MNHRVCLLMAVIIVSVFSLSSIASVNSFHTPSSTDDSKYEPFGPRPSQLLIKIYTDYAAELQDFKAKQLDVFDFPLDPLDYQWFETNDPSHSQYATAFFAEFNMYEYDTNDQAFPTSSIAFRQALSHIIDKDDLIASGGVTDSTMKLDSPLGSHSGWYNSDLSDLYNLAPRSWANGLPTDDADWIAAYELIESALGDPVPDPVNGGYMWNWTTPAPLNTTDPTGTFPPVPNGYLLVYPRIDTVSIRQYQGTYLQNLLQTVLPAKLAQLGYPTEKQGHINVQLVPSVRGYPFSQQVFQYFRYHIYTGGWSFGRDPDTPLGIFTSSHYYPDGLNYVGYDDPVYDWEVAAMLAATKIGNATDPSGAKYHAFRAQDILMQDAGVIPVLATGGYKPYLADWRGVANQAGFGVSSWWTFLNAHKASSTGGDVIRYGFQGDVVNLNIVTAEWYWDWEVLGKVYDTLITVNPYDVSQDLPYLASSWNIKEGEYGNTVLTFNLRDDVWWQDIPFHDRSAVTYDGGHEIDGPFTNVQFAPVDVAFTLEYVRDMLDSWNGIYASPVDHVVLNPVWQSLWPYNATYKPPWYTADIQYRITWQGDYVQFDSTVPANSIAVYFNQVMTWIGLHWIGGLPIMPMHLWGAITQSETLVVDTMANDLIYGTGPYIYLSRTPGVSLTMIPYVAGHTYRGLTLQNSYFYQPVGEAGSPTVEIPGQSVIVTQTLYNNAPVQMNLSVSYVVDIRRKVEEAWVPVAGLPSIVSAGEVDIPPFGTAVVSAKVRVLSGVSFGEILGVGNSFKWTYIIRGTNPWTWLASFTGHSHEPGFPSDFALYVPGDINDSGGVDVSDAALLGFYWHKTVPPAPANVDINGDGIIDVSDAAILGVNWHKHI